MSVFALPTSLMQSWSRTSRHIREPVLDHFDQMAFELAVELLFPEQETEPHRAGDQIADKIGIAQGSNFTACGCPRKNGFDNSAAWHDICLAHLIGQFARGLGFGDQTGQDIARWRCGIESR